MGLPIPPNSTECKSEKNSAQAHFSSVRKKHSSSKLFKQKKTQLKRTFFKRKKKQLKRTFQAQKKYSSSALFKHEKNLSSSALFKCEKKERTGNLMFPQFIADLFYVTTSLLTSLGG